MLTTLVLPGRVQLWLGFFVQCFKIKQGHRSGITESLSHPAALRPLGRSPGHAKFPQHGREGLGGLRVSLSLSWGPEPPSVRDQAGLRGRC